MPKALKGVILALLVVSLVALTVVSWLFLPTKEAGLVNEVYALLQSYYVKPDEVTPELLEKGSVDEMLAALNDPYTFHINASYWQWMQSYFEGDFFIGIGVKLCNDEIDGEIVPAVFGVVPDSPADEAGIEPGDLILAIDNSSAVGMNATEAALEMQGAEGTNVTLLVQHQDGQSELNITRRQIDISTWWQGLVDGNIAYIDIDYFSDQTDDELRSALEYVQVYDAAGIILDLCDDLGGIVWEQQQDSDYSGGAVGVAGQFLEENTTILWLNYGRGENESILAGSGGLATDLPLAVLVNGDTASAAEMVAGALQDNERAALIGNQTYGKGAMQVVAELSDGSAVFITSAYWYTPNRYATGAYLTKDNGLIPDREGGLQEAIDYITGL
jgi:carboxyl-terminal processing protease